ncbi:hypothetical protein [Desulfitibacter alkalitolerans]|uniref:hypothetical protein n=1 Tax=Desulfitibacter alkalitolerans TaxID=264641 RepID=UPI0004871CF4|nr:hypothetical protein [Desulfitibacter alkalitolerans]
MSKSSKKLMTIALLAVILLVGCSIDENAGKNEAASNNHSIKPETDETMGKATYSPVKILYAVDNPINIISINASEDMDHHRSYFQIRGLKDQIVENSINEAIKQLFEQMLPYGNGEKHPPYRGIQSAISGDKVISYSAISVDPQFNCNNILSVAAHVSGTYNCSTSGPSHFSFIEALNFDLNTGKTFLINDVFTNDVNGLEIVNEAIANELTRRSLTADIDHNLYYDSFALVAPFKGVTYDQKFYLSNYGLNVVIDYNNPEFDVGFSYAIVTVPFYTADGCIAVTERFYDKNQSIFTEDAVSLRFLPDYQQSVHREAASYMKNGTQWYVSIGYPKNLSKKLINIINVLRVAQEKEVALLSQESPVTFVEQNIYAHRMGAYVIISSHLIIGQAEETQWSEDNFVYTETGEPIQLEDLFVDEYDYSSLINNAINRTIEQHGLAPGFDVQDLLRDITFRLNDTSISFVTKPYAWDPTSSKYPLHFDISYEEIGYKNLKIFNH